MEVLSLCPFRAAGLVWQPRPSAWSLLVVCKGTFDLVPGVARLSEIQDYPNEEDSYWDDNPRKSLHSASDFVPSKPRADVVLVGHAFAPHGMETASFVTRLAIADIAKGVEVVSERVWTSEPRVRYGSRITKGPLRWERAAGGEDTGNPVGIPLDGAPDDFGMYPLPALQPPGFLPVRRDQPIPPVGYGPIAPSWPSRRAKLGYLAASFNPASWHKRPLPAELDPSFFNSAPEDQQTAELRADERIELVGLHPEEPELVTTLPGIKPRAFVEREGKALEEVVLRCDTAWFDTDRQVVTLTWRGQVPLATENEAGRVVLAMEQPGRTLSIGDIDRLLGRPGAVDPSDEEVDSGVEWIEPEESGIANRPAGLDGEEPPAVAPSQARSATLIGFGATDPHPPGAAARPDDEPAREGDGATPAISESGAPPKQADRITSDAAPPKGASSATEQPEEPERAERQARTREHALVLWCHAAADDVAARIGPVEGQGAASALLQSSSRAPSPPRSLTITLEAAIGQDGRFVPPPVTLTGDLSMTLAPVDRLRTLLTIAAVLEPSDARTVTLRGKGERLLAGPSPDGAAWLACRIADDLEAALAARAGASDALAGARRTLHAARAYSRASVLGGRHVRGILRDAGGANLAVYISEEACVHLPLDERFRARIVGELFPKVDMADPAPYALRAAAIARIVMLR